MVQHVTDPTHCKGHTLDLVLSYGITINNLKLLNFNVSDHKAVSCSKPCAHKLLDQAQLIVLIECLQLSQPVIPLQMYPSTHYLKILITQLIAPLKTKQIKHNPILWLNRHTKDLKRQCRKAERKLCSSSIVFVL